MSQYILPRAQLCRRYPRYLTSSIELIQQFLTSNPSATTTSFGPLGKLGLAHSAIPTSSLHWAVHGRPPKPLLWKRGKHDFRLNSGAQQDEAGKRSATPRSYSKPHVSPSPLKDPQIPPKTEYDRRMSALRKLFFDDLRRFEKTFGTFELSLEGIRKERAKGMQLSAGSRKVKISLLRKAIDKTAGSKTNYESTKSSIVVTQESFLAIVIGSALVDKWLGQPLWTRQERDFLFEESKTLRKWMLENSWDETSGQNRPENARAPTSDMDRHYTRELEVLFYRELDQLQNKSKGPDDPPLANSRRRRQLLSITSDLDEWEKKCSKRKTGLSHSIGARTLMEQSDFLAFVGSAVRRDKYVTYPLWTEQERRNLSTAKNAVEERMMEDPHYGREVVWPKVLKLGVSTVGLFWLWKLLFS
ncbi:MAG: hypothetical protein Q9204_006197 [Flavoplaca sp. TL-2023a]